MGAHCRNHCGRNFNGASHAGMCPGDLYPMTVDEAVRALIEHGPIGIVAAIAVIAAWQKDRQVTKVYETLVAKMENITATLSQVSSEMRIVIQRMEERPRRNHHEYDE